MNAIIRKQWTENEKLSYPIIQLPLELAKGGTGLLGNRRMWLGFAIAGGIDLINGLHGLFPVLPSFKPDYDISPLFTTSPWNAIGWTPVAIYPFVVGLGYFLPLNLAFSAWFFHIFWKAELIFRRSIGLWSTPGPYRSYETSGAWMILAVFALMGDSKVWWHQTLSANGTVLFGADSGSTRCWRFMDDFRRTQRRTCVSILPLCILNRRMGENERYQMQDARCKDTRCIGTMNQKDLWR